MSGHREGALNVLKVKVRKDIKPLQPKLQRLSLSGASLSTEMRTLVEVIEWRIKKTQPTIQW